MRKTRILLLITSAVVLAGCEPQPIDSVNSSTIDTPEVLVESSEATTQESAAVERGEDPAADAVSITVASWEEIEKEVAAAKGIPVVVDIWSTSCLPCMKEFHGLVELHNQHGQEIKCISFCIDYIGVKTKPPESYLDGALAFLQSQNSTLTNFLSATADRELYTKLDLDSIPAVYVYAADGSLAKKFVDTGEDNEFSYAGDINPFIAELLKPNDESKN